MFNRIYDAALKQDKAELNKILEENKYFIDVKEEAYPFFTPAQKLASEGNVAAAEFLRDEGANAYLLSMAYRMAGNEDHPKKHVNAPYLNIRGYAMKGNQEKVDEILALYKDSYVMLAEAAMGYAMGGHDALVKQCTAINYKTLDEAAKGYAMVGRDQQVDELWRLGASASALAQGYAQARSHEKVEEFFVLACDTGTTNNEILYLHLKRVAANDIATSCALVGDDVMVEKYIALGANISDVAAAYAMAGNHGKVAEFRKRGAEHNSIVNSYHHMGYWNVPKFCLQPDPLVGSNQAQKNGANAQVGPNPIKPSSKKNPQQPSCFAGIGMQVLGGFIAAIGAAAIAVAFVVLSAATFNIAGLAVVGVGIAMLLTGAGMFASQKVTNCRQNVKPESCNKQVKIPTQKENGSYHIEKCLNALDLGDDGGCEQYLKGKKIDVNSLRTKDGKTLLMRIFEQNISGALPELLKAMKNLTPPQKLDLEAVDNQGNNFLHYALNNYNPDSSIQVIADNLALNDVMRNQIDAFKSKPRLR